MRMLAKFVRDQAGVTSLEYVLLATLVGIALIVGAGALGTQLNSSFGVIAGKVPPI